MNAKPLHVQIAALRHLYAAQAALQSIAELMSGAAATWTGPTHMPEFLFEEAIGASKDVRELLLGLARDQLAEFGRLWGIEDADSNLVAHGYSPAQAQAAAYGSLNQTIMRQAATMSYNDAFLMILIVFLCTSPAILLLRKSQGGGAGAAADAH